MNVRGAWDKTFLDHTAQPESSISLDQAHEVFTTPWARLPDDEGKRHLNAGRPGIFVAFLHKLGNFFSLDIS